MGLLEVLIPTYCRKTALAVTLAGLFGQTFRQFDIIVSSQAERNDYLETPEIQTIIRAFRHRGQSVQVLKHLPRRGMAEQRNFLLAQSSGKYVQFLDDDLLLEPEVVERMLSVLQSEGCGFVGCPVTGLSYLGDHRPWQEHIELWNGRVRPERLDPATVPWMRHKVNNAANPMHLYERLSTNGNPIRYKVAWVGGNVMYDRAKLVDVGGFGWWTELPPGHAGEDVLAQLLVLNRYGGCGILPTGTYHLEMPTTVEDRSVNAVSLLPRYLESMNATEIAIDRNKNGGRQ